MTKHSRADDSRFGTILGREMTRKEFLGFGLFAVASIFGIAGLIREFASHAATSTGSVEPENGTTSSNATVTTDSNASGGKAVRFGPPTSGAFVLGVTEPNATNTGIAASGLTLADLTVVTGDQTIHDSNVPASGVIQNKYYKGFVTVILSTKTLTFRNCYFEGRTFSYTEGTDQPPAGGLVACGGMAQPVNFEFCTARPIQPSYGLDCLAGASLGTVTRCDLSRGEDILYYVGYPGQTPWMKAYGNYIHDLTFWNDDPQRANDSPAGWTHNDGIQCTGSINGEIIGNSIKAYVDPSSGYPNVAKATYPNGACNSCCMMTISAGAHQNLKIQNNWFQGGIAASVQMPYQVKSWNTSCSWDVSGNRFGTSMHAYGGAPNYHYGFAYFGATLGPSLANYHDNLFNSSDPYTPNGLGSSPATETTISGSGTAAQASLRHTSATKIPGT